MGVSRARDIASAPRLDLVGVGRLDVVLHERDVLELLLEELAGLLETGHEGEERARSRSAGRERGGSSGRRSSPIRETWVGASASRSVWSWAIAIRGSRGRTCSCPRHLSCGATSISPGCSALPDTATEPVEDAEPDVEKARLAVGVAGDDIDGNRRASTCS